MYILDTNVISEIKRGSRAPTQWIKGKASEIMFISVVVVSELAKGIALKERSDMAAAARLANWLATLQREYSGRTIQISEQIAEVSGRFLATRTRGVHDCQIAATAYVHNLAVVTRNVVDFSDLPVDIVNPWNSNDFHEF